MKLTVKVKFFFSLLLAGCCGIAAKADVIIASFFGKSATGD